MITEQCPEGFYAVESLSGCSGCYFRDLGDNRCMARDCEPYERYDGKSVVFKKIETPPKSKVVEFLTAHNPDHVLKQAIGEFDTVLIIGWRKDLDFEARASTNADKKECLWLASQFVHKLFNGDYTE